MWGGGAGVYAGERGDLQMTKKGEKRLRDSLRESQDYMRNKLNWE